jgi:hypothetical protein
MQSKRVNFDRMELTMTELEQWEKENEAFLIKIGQGKPAAAKPITKKDEE